MTPKMKNIRLIRNKSIGIYINEDTLQITGLALIPIIRGHKIGFMDSHARVIIDPVYDSFKGKFLDNYDYICVKKNDKWGVVNFEGEICQEIEYDYIVQGIINYELHPWERDYLFTLCKEKQYAVIKNDIECGKETLVDFGTYDWISGFDSRLAIVRKGNKYGIIDNFGTLVLPIEYNHIEEFYNKGKTSTKAYKAGTVDELKFSDLAHQEENDDDSYNENYDYDSSAYDNSYYNDSLDLDQQSEDFWETL